MNDKLTCPYCAQVFYEFNRQSFENHINNCVGPSSESDRWDDTYYSDDSIEGD